MCSLTVFPVLSYSSRYLNRGELIEVVAPAINQKLSELNQWKEEQYKAGWEKLDEALVAWEQNPLGGPMPLIGRWLS